MNLQDSSFNYEVALRLSLIQTQLAQALPGINELALSSRIFLSYPDCVQSAKKLMDDFVQGHNALTAEELKVSTEVNPVYSGQPSRSADWGDDELARLWVFNSADEASSKISALGQASIYALPKVKLLAH